MKDRIIELINILKEVKKETNLAIEDHTLFSEACTFCRGELVNLNRQGYNYSNNKKVSQEPSNKPIGTKNVQEDKPTEKQISMLKRLKVKDIDNLTKNQARLLIRDKLDKQDNY
jgi:hypothetical protein